MEQHIPAVRHNDQQKNVESKKTILKPKRSENSTSKKPKTKKSKTTKKVRYSREMSTRNILQIKVSKNHTRLLLLFIGIIVVYKVFETFGQAAEDKDKFRFNLARDLNKTKDGYSKDPTNCFICNGEDVPEYLNSTRKAETSISRADIERNPRPPKKRMSKMEKAEFAKQRDETRKKLNMQLKEH